MVARRCAGMLFIVGALSFCGVMADDENFGKNNAGIATQTEVQIVNKIDDTASSKDSIATQAVVQDSKGGEIRVVTTIRDTSWPSNIVYSPSSYYEVLPQFYKDKISIREVALSNSLDYFFSLFGSAIPRQWHPSSDKVTVWHLDLFDAMTLGVQDANVAIVQAALDRLPYSKSILNSGKTTDFMINQAVTADGKFKIDQFINLACDSMETRVNKQRILKWISAGMTTAVVACEYNNVSYTQMTAKVLAAVFNKSLGDVVFPQGEHKFNLNVYTGDSGAKQADSGNTKVAAKAEPAQQNRSLLPLLTMGTGAVATFLAHRLQHIYVDGYIKVLDLLVSADGVTFDHAVAYEKIKALKNKVQWFGLSNTYGARLQVILNKL